MNRCLMFASALLIGWATMAGAAAPSEPADDLAAIRSSIESYVSAFNRGDARAVAQHWSEQGEWVGPNGERLRGVANIEQEMRTLFAGQRGLRIAVLEPRIRLLTPEVALEEGLVRVSRPGDVPDESAYIAIHVKRAGQWQLESVRETETARPPAGGEALQALEWLVGDWVDQSQESTVETSVGWSKNRTFLVYAFKVSSPGTEPLEGTQVIGWDPVAKVIRSWIFDSDGGFGEGVWKHDGTHWLVKTTMLHPDASKASATNVYTPMDANSFQWKSIGRQVNGMFLANIEPVKVVRKPTAKAKEATPKAKAPPKEEKKPTASPQETKSKSKEPAAKKIKK
jgi:uncharacterized protein (TIGR02246 family)